MARKAIIFVVICWIAVLVFVIVHLP